MSKSSTIRIADAGFDPIAAARSARDQSLDDVGDLIRRADVPGHVDTAMDAASEAVRGVIQRLPGQRRSRRRGPLVLAGVLLGILATAGLAAWLARRNRRAGAMARIGEDQFDREALDRAADEGMSAAHGTDATHPGTNGAGRELPAVGELV